MGKLRNKLPIGAQVDNYVIRKILGGGGFSIVYLADALVLKKAVVIKEYLPARIAERGSDNVVRAANVNMEHLFQNGRLLFFQEAGILTTLEHDNIVKVLSFFRANGTVYMVMEYEEGINLQRYICKRSGKLSERFLLTVFPPLLDALQFIHERGYLHQDIKPDNIFLRPGGRPLLLDFGAVHQRQLSRQNQTGQVTCLGFSPIEQYNKNGYVGPWTDIYAIGATMRSCITGRPPPDALERQQQDHMPSAVDLFKKQYSPTLLKAIDWAMELNPELRPQSVQAFKACLPTVDSIKTPSTAGFIDKLALRFGRSRN